MNRRSFFFSTLAAGVSLSHSSTSQALPTDRSSRATWLAFLQRVAEPVLTHMVSGTLQTAMPMEAVAGHEAERAPGMPLEAFGRLLSGIAPWLELDDAAMPSEERKLQQRYRSLALEGLQHGLELSSNAYLRFGTTGQTLVDAAFLALGMLRAPRQILAHVNQDALAAALVAQRSITPGMSNWLLFSAMNEALLFHIGKPWKQGAVRLALESHAQWYLGDSVYGDGPHFHADFYNSFVIHPFLLQVLDVLGEQQPSWTQMRSEEQKRASRYAAIQERLIAPDGSYPVTGRSITYRCGAFHALADVAARRMLPSSLAPAQVRCALAAVIDRTLSPAGTFTPDGWLRIGLAGHQPSLAETYISTGSLYLCAEAFLPLGLASHDPFWRGDSLPWTAQKVWSGLDLPADHAQD